MEIKGTAVRAIRDYVMAEYNDRYKKWVETLPAESKEIYEGVIDSSKWYSLKFGGIEPTRKIAEMFFGGDYVKGASESGKYSAQKALTGIYKVFVKASTPSYIVQRASRIFATYYQPCKMELLEKTSNSVMLEISKMDTSDVVVDYRIMGWMERALEISGAKDIKYEMPKSISKGDTTTIFNIHWQ